MAHLCKFRKRRLIDPASKQLVKGKFCSCGNRQQDNYKRGK